MSSDDAVKIVQTFQQCEPQKVDDPAQDLVDICTGRPEREANAHPWIRDWMFEPNISRSWD